MASKAVRAHATNKNGDQLTVHAQETDALVLPVPQLEHLHQFRPDLVDFVIEETRLEARHRREQDSKINTFIFVERIFGQLGAITVAVLGVGGGVYAGIHGEPALGGTIATITIGTLAVAFISRNKPKSDATTKEKQGGR